jgi:hypothetical protein
MRPERFHYEMNKAFNYWFKTKSVDKFLPLMREIKRVYKKLQKTENDNRSGFETYGYDDPEAIDYHMLYISDRWRCAFRIRWLIDGIENGKIK